MNWLWILNFSERKKHTHTHSVSYPLSQNRTMFNVEIKEPRMKNRKRVMKNTYKGSKRGNGYESKWYFYVYLDLK